MTADSVAVVVLAAGASSRYGGVKLLAAPTGGEPLLRRTVRVVLEAGLGPVMVVLGAHRSGLSGLLADLTVEVAVNDAWRDGVGRSIAAGIAAVRRRHSALGGAVVVPADLLHLEGAHLRLLVDAARRGGVPMAATAPPDAPLQAPAYFARELFPDLEALTGDRGARDLLRRDRSRVAAVVPSFPLEDLDTPE